MISRRQFLGSSALASFVMPHIAENAFAQSAWPSREVHSISAFPPGAGADVFVRFYSKQLQDALGKTVIVENKVGAFGNIAAEYVTKAKADGYTIFIAPGSSILAAAPSLYKSLPFDPLNDFEHITTLSKLPFILIVAGDSPYKSVADLTRYLKQKRDKASYGSVSNTGLISSELYKAFFNLPTVEVKYKDPAAMLNDLYGGNIVFSHFDPITASSLMQQGKIRALATSAKDPFKALPGIQSAQEAGIGNSDIIAWWSVHAPKGTPKPVLQKLETLFNDIAVSEATVKFLSPLGSDPFPGNSTILRELLAKDTKAWHEYVRIGKMEPV
jgi:tripartite-type tricarboxylate transporter receptor subunit TctC